MTEESKVTAMDEVVDEALRALHSSVSLDHSAKLSGPSQGTPSSSSANVYSFRQCIQQDLRHLQRTLRRPIFDSVWEELDDTLVGEVRRMRARVYHYIT